MQTSGQSLRRTGLGLALGASALALAACASTPAPVAKRPMPGSQASNRPSQGSTSAPRAPQANASGRVPGTMRPYQIKGVWYYPEENPDYDVKGVASWYGEQFHNQKTADGEIFDMNGISAAHKTLPLPSLVQVTNLDNGRKLTVRVNDRGPFVGDRVIDLSYEAADRLGFAGKGLANVEVRYLGPAADANSAVIPKMDAPAPLQPRPSPVAPPPEPAPPIMIAQSGRYRVQAGSFADPANAKAAADKAAMVGDAQIEPAEVNGNQVYRVVVGPAADQQGAGRLLDRVLAAGFRGAIIIGSN
ncbi:MAG: hypothetical protein JWM33_2735 [Caulobacteraceae bacterium]|nr:hypothetical protein [Caulobacteraceae bacterium]